MENTNIVPAAPIRSLSPNEIRDLCDEVVEITATYEEANVGLQELSIKMGNLETAGKKYNELTDIVRKKISSCCMTGVLKKVVNAE